MTTLEPTFGATHFGTADLGHKQRKRCLVKIADAIQRHPGGTLPHKLHSPKDYKAMTRLMNRPEVTHAAVLQAHCQRTLELMRQVDGPVLVLHDTTELDYSGLHSIADLGSIGCNLGRGYLCHNSLAFDPQQRRVLGLAHQLLHERRLVGRKEGVASKRQRLNRESRLWPRAVSAVGACGGSRLGHVRAFGSARAGRHVVRDPFLGSAQRPTRPRRAEKGTAAATLCAVVAPAGEQVGGDRVPGEQKRASRYGGNRFR
jgi:hypothetical protein